MPVWAILEQTCRRAPHRIAIIFGGLELTYSELRDLSGIRLAASGAPPLALRVLERMLEAFSGSVCELCGLSECTMCATANPPARDAIRPGSVGLPICDTEVMITQVATGEPLPPNQEGEVAIRGPQLLAGYWNKPEETAKVLREGWLFTGDIGRMDDDGYLYITDRKKDMIIYKGYNVCPRKLEEILFQHPAVEQCAVVGKPDINAGEAPAAFVQLRSEMECSLEEVMERADSQVAHYKKIREIIVVDQIPVSAAGKVLKRELGERLRQTA